jgi:hypothetical protein
MERVHRSWPAWVIFVVIVPGFLIALLIGPRVPTDKQEFYCVSNIVSSSPFGLSLNCDALLHLAMTRDPGIILREGKLRQSRPLFAVPATVLRPLFLWATDVPGRIGLHPDNTPENLRWAMPDLIGKDFPAFLAYAVVSSALLVAIFWLYLWLAGLPERAAGALFIAAVGLLLVGNDVVKAFFWSPHAQLYNILAPLIGVWAMIHPVGSWRRGAVVGFLAGVAILVYPLFLLVAACFGLRGIIDAAAERRLSPLLAGFASVGAVFVAPLAWYLFVLWLKGSFYSDTVDFNQGVWIIASLRKGTFWADLAAPTSWLWLWFKEQAFIVGIMASLAFVLFLASLPRQNVERSDLVVIICCLIVSALAFVFYALAGLNVWRSAFAPIAPLVLAVGVLARAASAMAPRWALWTAAVAALIVAYGQMIYTAVKAGPYS